LLTELTVTLPEGLAREAESGGLLTSESIQSLLRQEIRRRRVNRLFEAADRLASLSLPLTASEIEAEIETVRRTRRTFDASCR